MALGTTIQTTPEQISRLVRNRDKRSRAAVQRATMRGATRGKALMRRVTPIDMGQLRASWKVKRYPRAKTRGVAVLAELINDAPHAGIAELGARPHAVSREGREAIYQWVYRHRAQFGFVTKSGRAKRMKKGWVAAGRGGGETWDEDPELARIVWGIVQKIRREGQAPTYFVRKRLDFLKDFVVAEYVRELKKLASSKSKGSK